MGSILIASSASARAPAISSIANLALDLHNCHQTSHAKLMLHGSMVPIAIIGGKYCRLVVAIAELAKRARRAKRAKILGVYAAIDE